MGKRHHRGVAREVAGTVEGARPFSVGKLLHVMESAAKRVGNGALPVEDACREIAMQVEARGRDRSADAFLAVAAGVSERVRGGGETWEC